MILLCGVVLCPPLQFWLANSRFEWVPSEITNGKNLLLALHHKAFDSDPNTNSVYSICKWSNKWLLEGQIDLDISNWVVNNKAKPGKAFGTIKTHKDENPLRLIISCCGNSYWKSLNFNRILSHSIGPKVALFCQRHNWSIAKDLRSKQEWALPWGYFSRFNERCLDYR